MITLYSGTPKKNYFFSCPNAYKLLKLFFSVSQYILSYSCQYSIIWFELAVLQAMLVTTIKVERHRFWNSQCFAQILIRWKMNFIFKAVK